MRWFAGFLFFICWMPQVTVAQTFERIDPSFREDETLLRIGAAGGLNNPQLSTVDLNRDDQPDLYVFDRTGNVHLTFLNDKGRYVYAPEYIPYFPRLKNWVLLRDFNGDEAVDIFTYSDFPGISGLAVFSGYYEKDTLRFRRMSFGNKENLLQYPLPGGGRTQIFISNIDYPAVDDIDCDGDLDILTFNIGGGYVEFFQNQSLEMGFGLDSLIFILADDCWGGIFESGLTPEVEIAPEPGFCAGQLTGESGVVVRHVGSTLLTLNSDGDQDRDLILGDVSFPLVNYLNNAGSCEQAWMVRQEVGFPIDDRSIDIDFFPVVFNLDLNNDGKADLAAAPNAAGESEDREVLWFYEKVGTDRQPTWEFRQSDFLVGEMLDFGSGAYPLFMDVNADDLPDLVVGNKEFYSGPGQRESRLWLFENRGTPRQPAWRLIDEDYLKMSEFNPESYHFSPASGDLDGDGDLDLIVGETNGQLYYAENIAGPGNPASFAPWQYPYSGIDVGQESKPCIADLNGDGLPDLIVGERNGNINYFQNQGSREDPFFDPDPEISPNTFFLGQIDTRTPGSATGASAPVVYQASGEIRLITGTEGGAIEVYLVEKDLSSAFPLLHDRWGGIEEGVRTSIALADTDKDGLLEAAVGNERGGLSFFRTDLPAGGTVSVETAPGTASWDVYPNPFRDHFEIRCQKEPCKAIERIQVFDVSGRRVLEKRVTGTSELIKWQDLPSGVYFVRIFDGEQASVRKVIRM